MIYEYHSENLTLYSSSWMERMRLLEMSANKYGWELLQIIVDENGHFRAILRREKVNDNTQTNNAG